VVVTVGKTVITEVEAPVLQVTVPEQSLHESRVDCPLQIVVAEAPIVGAAGMGGSARVTAAGAEGQLFRVTVMAV
jgi:hypothetical protein